MRRVSRYLLLLAVLGLQQTATHAALRGTDKDTAGAAAAVPSEARASRYRVYDVQPMAGAEPEEPEIDIPRRLQSGYADNNEPQQRPRMQRAANDDDRVVDIPRRAQEAGDEDEVIDMPRRLQSGYADNTDPRPPRVMTASQGARAQRQGQQQQAIDDEDEVIDMPRRLQSGYADNTDPRRPRVMAAPTRNANASPRAIEGEDDRTTWGP